MSILKTNQLMLCREISRVENHKKYVNTTQQGAGGTHSYHWIPESPPKKEKKERKKERKKRKCLFCTVISTLISYHFRRFIKERPRRTFPLDFLLKFSEENPSKKYKTRVENVNTCCV